MKLRCAALVVLVLAETGCIDSTRVNSTCSWRDSVDRPLNLSERSDREHLRVDAEIANELMVRAGDVHYRTVPALAQPIRETCMRSVADQITSQHRVTHEQLRAAEHDRVWWADVLAVFLPVAIVAAVVVDAITRRICRFFEPENRMAAVASLVVAVPVIALITIAIANFWSFPVESWRLRDGHVSNRADFLPVVAHGTIAYLVAIVICSTVAVVRFARTPLTGGTRRSFAVGRPLSSR